MSIPADARQSAWNGYEKKESVVNINKNDTIIFFYNIKIKDKARQMKYSLVKAYVNLDAVEKNILSLKQIMDKKSKFMAVVKADAYGHGAVRVAKKALESGADALGVARLGEALILRQAGIGAPLLVFGYIYPDRVAIAGELDIMITIYNLDMAKALSQAACSKGIVLNAHLKVDTGMGRVGVLFDPSHSDLQYKKKAVKEIKKIAALPGIDVQGIYTHLAAADHADRNYTTLQLHMFDSLLHELEKENIVFSTIHAANSAGIIGFPESHYDMVRAGVSMYGLYPSSEVDHSKVDLIPAMELKSIISSVRKVPKNFKVSYGMTYETEKETLLASVPVGYADGFSRLLSSNGYMLVKGIKAPIAGRICMDQTIIDVGHIPDVKVEDEVVLIGGQNDKTITADDIAEKINTINYEIVSSLTSRVERIYV